MSEEIETVEFIPYKVYGNYTLNFVKNNINNYLPDLKDRHLMRIVFNPTNGGYEFNYQKGNEKQLNAINKLKEEFLHLSEKEIMKLQAIQDKRDYGYLSE